MSFRTASAARNLLFASSANLPAAQRRPHPDRRTHARGTGGDGAVYVADFKDSDSGGAEGSRPRERPVCPLIFPLIFRLSPDFLSPDFCPLIFPTDFDRKT